MNCCFLANILMGTIYLFAGKFSYIVLNKAKYEKVVEIALCEGNAKTIQTYFATFVVNIWWKTTDQCERYYQESL